METARAEQQAPLPEFFVELGTRLEPEWDASGTSDAGRMRLLGRLVCRDGSASLKALLHARLASGGGVREALACGPKPAP